jgi:hypothetical protein
MGFQIRAHSVYTWARVAGMGTSAVQASAPAASSPEASGARGSSPSGSQATPR